MFICTRVVLRTAFTASLLLAVTMHLFAQQDNRCIIQGSVRDAETGDPVEFANVFLASTTFGTAANAKGVFILRGVPPGSYQLVASRVGFFPAAVTIQCSAGSTISHKFALRSRVISSEGIDVEAASQEEWKRDFAEFRDEFLGADEYGTLCTVLNPEALILRRDKEKGELTASSNKPLEVVNMAMGYRLNVDIQSFSSCRQEGTITYELFNRFEEIYPQDSVQSQRWRANRERAYKGSRMHFLRALANGILEEENFRVYRGELQALRIQRGTYVGPTLEGIVTKIGTGLKQLSWNGYLRVEYRGEEGWTNNIFQLIRTPVFLEAPGYLHDPTAVVVLTESPWGRDRLGKTLPLNYGQ